MLCNASVNTLTSIFTLKISKFMTFYSFSLSQPARKIHFCYFFRFLTGKPPTKPQHNFQ